MNDTKALLEAWVQQLLELPKHQGVTAPVTNDIAGILGEISGVSADSDMNDTGGKRAINGVAITPVQAAKCCQESLRTQMFLKGVYQAIENRLKVQRTVHLLYAGTGPFGTLVLPLLHMFDSDRVCVTLLDIHRENIDGVKKVVDALGVSPSIAAVELADASAWHPTPETRFDIILSETMNTFLRREPQVSIFAHLQQFLTPNGILIPENIRLDAWLADDDLIEIEAGSNGGGMGAHLQEVFSLNRTAAKQVHLHGFGVLKGALQVPELSKPYTKIAFTTRIDIHGDNMLTDGESSLNMIEYVHDLELKSHLTIPYHYELEPEAKFIFDLPVYRPDRKLPGITDTGELKLYYLKRMWHKNQLQCYGVVDEQAYQDEWALDLILMERVGGKMHQWFEYFFQKRLSFSKVEEWVDLQFGPFSQDRVNNINEKLLEQYALPK